MKRHLGIKWFFVALLIGVAVMLPCFSVQASDKPFMTIDSSRGLSGVMSSVNKVSKKIANFKFITSGDALEGGGIPVYLNKERYNLLDISEKRELMEVTLTEVSNSDLPAKERTRLYNFIAEQDSTISATVRQLSQNVTADYSRAWSWFKPFSGGISTFLGFLAISIVILISVTTVIDIAYLAIPPLQMLLSRSNGKPRWVSNEAYKSNLEAESSSAYKSNLSLYLPRRTKIIFVLALALGYLLNSQIFMWVGRLIDTISIMFSA